MANNKVTVEQIVRRTISDNNICLESRNDTNLVEENEFLRNLLPQTLSVAELRTHLEPLNLGNDGKSIGQAIKYLRSNGLEFLNEDIKIALKT